MSSEASGKRPVLRRLAAVLAADVVAYSRLMGADEEATLARLKAHRRDVIDPKTTEHAGRIVKTTGDGILIEFPSVVEAVRCAVEIQQGMAVHNADVPPETRIEFRVGINLGDVIVEDGDIYGDGVNVAARLEALAEPGGICISRTVRDHILDKLPLALVDLGERTVKNITRPVQVYRVDLRAGSPGGHRLGGSASPSATPAGASPAEPFQASRHRDRPSIVVMPFDNLSGAQDEYFVDGVVEEITSALSRVREFFVIARQSAFAYKGRFLDVREVGRELGVTYVVEGTVRRGGDRLRISVQLVDAGTRVQLWSQRYEGAITDIFDFQDQIAAQVAGAIHPAIRNAEIELATRKAPSSLRAYDLVLRAYPKLWSRNPAANREAMSLLRDAIGIDAQYGRAHALLAWCHSQEVVYLWSSDSKHDRQCALQAIDATSGLIDDDPTALTAIGAALSQCGFDQDRAAAAIERALALDPNNAWAWARYAWVALYCDDGDRAKERFERALTLSPFDPVEFNLRVGIALATAQKGDYVQAAKLLREVLGKHPGLTWVYCALAAFSALAGDLETARDAVGKLLAAQPHASIAAMRVDHPMRNAPRFFDEFVRGWRLAGLPET